MTLQLLLRHYYMQTVLVIKVLLNYSDDNLYNIIDIISVSN